MLKLYECKQKIINEINNAQLTVEEIYYIVDDIYREISQSYNQQIQQENAISNTKQEESTDEIKKEEE